MSGGTTIALHVGRSRSDLRAVIDTMISGRPQTLLFDTGSVGISVLSNAVPVSVAQLSGAPFQEEFGGGVVLAGKVVSAPVSVSGLVTTGPIAIRLLQFSGTRLCRQEWSGWLFEVHRCRWHFWCRVLGYFQRLQPVAAAASGTSDVHRSALGRRKWLGQDRGSRTFETGGHAAHATGKFDESSERNCSVEQPRASNLLAGSAGCTDLCADRSGYRFFFDDAASRLSGWPFEKFERPPVGPISDRVGHDGRASFLEVCDWTNARGQPRDGDPRSVDGRFGNSVFQGLQRCFHADNGKRAVVCAVSDDCRLRNRFDLGLPQINRPLVPVGHSMIFPELRKPAGHFAIACGSRGNLEFEHLPTRITSNRFLETQLVRLKIRRPPTQTLSPPSIGAKKNQSEVVAPSDFFRSRHERAHESGPRVEYWTLNGLDFDGGRLGCSGGRVYVSESNQPRILATSQRRLPDRLRG